MQTPVDAGGPLSGVKLTSVQMPFTSPFDPQETCAVLDCCCAN